MRDDIKSQLTEAMKKVLLTGVGTIFMTEETIRSYLGEIKLPKELWQGLLDNAQKTKAEFLTLLARETAGVLAKIDVPEEIRKIVEENKIKISVEVSLEKETKN